MTKFSGICIDGPMIGQVTDSERPWFEAPDRPVFPGFEKEMLPPPTCRVFRYYNHKPFPHVQLYVWSLEENLAKYFEKQDTLTAHVEQFR
jgi:hypothetical protein